MGTGVCYPWAALGHCLKPPKTSIMGWMAAPGHVGLWGGSLPHSHWCFGVTPHKGLLLLSWLCGFGPRKLLEAKERGECYKKGGFESPWSFSHHLLSLRSAGQEPPHRESPK